MAADFGENAEKEIFGVGVEPRECNQSQFREGEIGFQPGAMMSPVLGCSRYRGNRLVKRRTSVLVVHLFLVADGVRWQSSALRTHSLLSPYHICFMF